MKRYSRQREMILHALQSLNHPCAPEIYEEIRRHYPQISLGTVYRNLNEMAENGEIMRIPVPGQSDKYDCRPEEHYHIICDGCGRVYDIGVCAINPLFGEIHKKAGEEAGVCVTRHDILFHALCADCLIPGNKPEEG